MSKPRLILKTVAATLLLCAIAGAAGGWLVLKSGWYDIGSMKQHWQPVYTLLEEGMHESVRHHAREVRTPATLGRAEVILQGAALYRAHCLQCHGGPGVSQAAIGKSMQPVPGPLVDAGRRWKPAELYWITRNGIKMSGMPAWGFHLDDDQLWALVAFIGKLPALSPQDYAALQDTANEMTTMAQTAPPSRPADIERGRLALTQFACHACHMIPDITGSEVFVGPPLDAFGKRKYIAGVLPNGNDNLQRWIRDPHAITPNTAMPTLGVGERDARDMAAYLLSLH